VFILYLPTGNIFFLLLHSALVSPKVAPEPAALAGSRRIETKPAYSTVLGGASLWSVASEDRVSLSAGCSIYSQQLK